MPQASPSFSLLRVAIVSPPPTRLTRLGGRYLEELVLPTFMRFQEHKLSSSGQDMGGSILFRRRIGFSGTPSELLPRDLGKCTFEPASEGDIMHTLTAPSIVSSYQLKDDWSPVSVLQHVATSHQPDGRPRYAALVDVGALITGYTNLQVSAPNSALNQVWSWSEGCANEYLLFNTHPFAGSSIPGVKHALSARRGGCRIS
eukprot:scaffold126661_cov28-Tisochrysis_lutea.AAC.2